jgi:mono/diheme cytochrome c family protein
MNLIKLLALAVAITIVAGISYTYPHSRSDVLYPLKTFSHLTAGGAAGPLQDGAAIYKAKCALCHAADGSGHTPAGKSMHLRDLRSAEVQKMSDADFSAIIRNGKGKMPAYGKSLSISDIEALVAYIRTIK